MLATESASSSLASADAKRPGAEAKRDSTRSISSLVGNPWVLLFPAHLQGFHQDGRRAVGYRAQLQRLALGAVGKPPKPPLVRACDAPHRTPELGRAALERRRFPH